MTFTNPHIILLALAMLILAVATLVFALAELRNAQVSQSNERRENERFRDCLLGVSCCSTCEVCRGAAQHALNGDQP